MFRCKIAELVLEIDNRYQYIEDACRDYIYEGEEETDIRLYATDSDLDSEKLAGEFFSPELLEFTAIHRALSDSLLSLDAFVLHSSLISIDGVGTAFLALSGTGKTTHTSLWKKAFGDKVTIINGDKPIVSLKDDKVIAYGSPWCGKENLQTNTSAELKNICFIVRSERNYVEGISSQDALPLLLQQIIIPKASDELLHKLDLVDKLMSSCKLYTIHCNKEEEAALVAYNALYSEK